jgi:hypothetical protein
MPVNQEELQRHLEDYARTTGKAADRFVCPITERRCDEQELIDGHILNAGIQSASRRTVIQYGPVDNFYGSRVEWSFVEFVNMPKKTPADLLQAVSTVRLRFADGSVLDGFFAGPEAGAKYPSVPISKDGQFIADVYVRTARDDPRLKQLTGEIEWDRVFRNAHWTATLVKSAYLALFAALGYRAVLDPFGEYVRQTLHAYYRDDASRNDATVYFYPFRNAVKLSLRQDKTPETEGPDTVNDNTFLFHYTNDDDFFFAASVRFKVNDVIAMVTLPMSSEVNRCDEVMRRYNRLMVDEKSLRQYVIWHEFTAAGWEPCSLRRSVTYVTRDGQPAPE